MKNLASDLLAFHEFGRDTFVTETVCPTPSGKVSVPTYVNEFWTSKQRAGHPLHEIAYRACFKPQLPRFFIDRLTKPGEVVYDPFMGRGTTPLEAALAGRTPLGNDVNPLSTMLVEPRICLPTLEAVEERLAMIDWKAKVKLPEELLVFYHPDTLQKLCALRHYLLTTVELDEAARWVRMVAVNRLTGHSPGYFSVYSLPPNQAVSVEAQKKINAKLGQTPEPRDVKGLILKRTRSLLPKCDRRTLEDLARAARTSLFTTAPASDTPLIRAASVDLVVTSPPFLDVVDYAQDNWLRCWFCGIDPKTVKITNASRLPDWREAMASVFRELARVVRPGGHVAFEVGEVRGGKIKLEETVIPVGVEAGLKPVLVLINDQEFTKTANCWGVTNRVKGTNTNRIGVFVKD